MSSFKLPNIHTRSKSYAYEAVGEFRTHESTKEREQLCIVPYEDESIAFQHALTTIFPVLDKKRGVKFKREKLKQKSDYMDAKYDLEVKRMYHTSSADRSFLPALV
jgi:hypothetical protein